MSQTIGVQGCSRSLHTSQTTVRKWLRTGEIKGQKNKGVWLIPDTEVTRVQDELEYLKDAMLFGESMASVIREAKRCGISKKDCIEILKKTIEERKI